MQIVKTNDKISWYHFCLETESKDFTNDEQSEVSLNNTLYDFSVEHRDILNIHQFLMVKNNIK